MLWNLDPISLMLMLGAIVFIAFIFGSTLDGIMGDDGFGQIGNMVLFIGGFFIAGMVAKSYGLNVRDLTTGLTTGIVGALATVTVMALLKAGIRRVR